MSVSTPTSGAFVKFYYIASDAYDSMKQAGTLDGDVIYYVYDNDNPLTNYIAVGEEKFTRSVSGSAGTFVRQSIVPTGGSVNIAGVTNNVEVSATNVTDFGAASSWDFEVVGTNLTISGNNGRAASGTSVTASYVQSATSTVALPGSSVDVVEYPQDASYVKSISSQ